MISTPFVIEEGTLRSSVWNIKIEPCLVPDGTHLVVSRITYDDVIKGSYKCVCSDRYMIYNKRSMKDKAGDRLRKNFGSITNIRKYIPKLIDNGTDKTLCITFEAL